MRVFFCNIFGFFRPSNPTHYHYRCLHFSFYRSFHSVRFWYFSHAKSWRLYWDSFVEGCRPKNHSFQPNALLSDTHRVVCSIFWFIHLVFCFSWLLSGIPVLPFLLVLSTETSIFFSNFWVLLWVLCSSWRGSLCRAIFRLIFLDRWWVLLASFYKNVLPFYRCRIVYRHFGVRGRWSRLIGSRVWFFHPFSFWFRCRVCWRGNRAICVGVRFVFWWFCFSFGWLLLRFWGGGCWLRWGSIGGWRCICDPCDGCYKIYWVYE